MDGYDDACLLWLAGARHKATSFGLPSSDANGGRYKRLKTEDHRIMLILHKAETESQGVHVL
jgi:hypothetical protein